MTRASIRTFVAALLLLGSPASAWATTTATPTTRAARAPAAPSASTPKIAAPRPARPGAGSSSRLFAPKQTGETEPAFFERAASELGKNAATGTGGELSPAGAAALERLARGALTTRFRTVVVTNGVVGSKSGNGYVTYYKNGWNEMNGVVRPSASMKAPPEETSTNKPPPPPEAHANPALEHDVRALLAKSEDGRRALAILEKTGVAIKFREGGGTVNSSESRTLFVVTKLFDGRQKALSWLAVAIVHEASHAWGMTPPTVSPLGDEYKRHKAASNVPMDLLRAMAKERKAYVNRQVAGEANAMSA